MYIEREREEREKAREREREREKAREREREREVTDPGCSRTHLIFGVDIGPCSDEPVHRLRVPPFRRDAQRRVSCLRTPRIWDEGAWRGASPAPRCWRVRAGVRVTCPDDARGSVICISCRTPALATARRACKLRRCAKRPRRKQGMRSQGGCQTEHRLGIWPCTRMRVPGSRRAARHLGGGIHDGPRSDEPVHHGSVAT